ncbi:MAG: type II toxin-antitoxin system VapC family toxin [Anaerolineae bacterium]
MTDYLLDTNHASWLLARQESVVARVREAQTGDSVLGISMTVLGELYYAVYASQRAAENLRRLQALVGTFTLWPFDALAAQEFGRIQAEQKAKGRPIPPMDAQIAAIVRLNNLTLLTDDHHFAFIDGITVENWRA